MKWCQHEVATKENARGDHDHHGLYGLEDEMRAMAVVRSIWPRAPRIGSTVRIACGVARTDGRDHYTVVRGPQDRFRRCRVLGYRIEVVNRKIELLVNVRMNRQHRLIEREHFSHVNCLELA